MYNFSENDYVLKTITLIRLFVSGFQCSQYRKKLSQMREGGNVVSPEEKDRVCMASHKPIGLQKKLFVSTHPTVPIFVLTLNFFGGCLLTF